MKEVLYTHFTVQIHKGDSSIWSTPWCPIWKSIHNHVNLPITLERLPQHVADLWYPQTRSWNMDLISHIFDDQVVLSIAQTCRLFLKIARMLSGGNRQSKVRAPPKKHLDYLFLKSRSNYRSKKQGVYANKL